MQDKNYLHIILSELKNKKVFNAMKDTECECCFDTIFEDDDFYFMGDKEKICQSCMTRMIELIEERIQNAG